MRATLHRAGSTPLYRTHALNGSTGIGNPDILKRRTLALLCSVRCPGEVILRTYDLAVALRNAGVPVVSGFHTPMEKECLALLLRGDQPVVICPARSIEGMRLRPEWKAPLEQRSLLVLSPFPEHERRVTARTALIRNRFVAELAAEALVVYATPGGRTEELCRELATAGKPLLTLDSAYNRNLLALGAERVSPDHLPDRWAGR